MYSIKTSVKLITMINKKEILAELHNVNVSNIKPLITPEEQKKNVL